MLFIMCLTFPSPFSPAIPPQSLLCFSNHHSLHLHTSGCKQAHRSVEDVHPFTCVALIVISPTPRVVQFEDAALMFAIKKGNDAMVTALLDHNANPDIQDKVRQGPQ